MSEDMVFGVVMCVMGFLFGVAFCLFFAIVRATVRARGGK